MTDAGDAVETSGWFCVLALTHAPMMIFLLYAALTVFERALGSKRGRTRETMPPREATPRVCVQIPTYNERACAKRAIDAACALRWPRESFEVQVLDDSDDGTEDIVEAACAEWRERGTTCDALWMSSLLRGKRRQTKAVALEHGRARTSADLIVVMDADAVVEEDYLEKMVPYFYDERGERTSDVAVVQPALAFANASKNFLTMHQAFKMEADAIVGNRAHIRAFGCVMRTGGAAMWSAAALRGVGGWDENLLCLEGTDMSIRTRMAGYSGKAAANVVVFTELPSTLSAYKSQQMRWIWAWAHLAKRHALAVAFNSYSGVPGTFARAWFALALLRPAQWVLLAVWVLMLPRLVAEGVWLGNADYVARGAAWLYALPLALILKADTFAVSDVESKVMSPPKSTGEAVSTARATAKKLSWIFPHACVSLGMIGVYCTGYARGILGSTHPKHDAPVSQLRMPKLGSGDVELSDADRGADETSCTKSEMWQLIFELGFVVAVAHASAQLMRGGIAGGSTETSIPLVSVLGFVVAGCSMYVAAGSWDDKCGPRSGERIRRAAATAHPEERAGLLSAHSSNGRPSSTRGTVPVSMRVRQSDGRYGTEHADIENARLATTFTIGEELSLEDVDTPPLATARETSKAIKKYKKMRDNGFDLENFSEYAQSDATSVMSEQAPSHVNFGSYRANSNDDFHSESGFEVERDDARSVDTEGRDRAALAHAVQVDREAQNRAKALRMANLRVNTTNKHQRNPAGWTRPPRSPSSRPGSTESSPLARSPSRRIGSPPKVEASDWVDSPIVESPTATAANENAARVYNL